jgi:hypothetical protein
MNDESVLMPIFQKLCRIDTSFHVRRIYRRRSHRERKISKFWDSTCVPADAVKLVSVRKCQLITGKTKS